MIDKETAKELEGQEIYVEKTDGYTWTGRLDKVTDTSLILKSKYHGKSIVSFDKVEEMGTLDKGRGGING